MPFAIGAGVLLLLLVYLIGKRVGKTQVHRRRDPPDLTEPADLSCSDSSEVATSGVGSATTRSARVCSAARARGWFVFFASMRAAPDEQGPQARGDAGALQREARAGRRPTSSPTSSRRHDASSARPVEPRPRDRGIAGARTPCWRHEGAAAQPPTRGRHARAASASTSSFGASTSTARRCSSSSTARSCPATRSCPTTRSSRSARSSPAAWR